MFKFYQQPDSPDLSPSDHKLLSKMKTELSGCDFESDDDVLAAVEHVLQVEDTDVYKEWILMLHSCSTMYVN